MKTPFEKLRRGWDDVEIDLKGTGCQEVWTVMTGSSDHGNETTRSENGVSFLTK